MVRSQPPIMADRMTARDFDEWAAAKATESFRKHQYVKRALREQKEDEQQAEIKGAQFSAIYVCICITLGIYIYLQSKYDDKVEADLRKITRKKS